MPSSFQPRRPLVAAVLGAALLAPLQPIVSAAASPSAPHARPASRATQATLTAYGDADSSGATHLSGSVRWSDGRLLKHKQHVELWARHGSTWVLVEKALTDHSGDVELRVTPEEHTTYRLRYAGSHSSRLSSVAAPTVSPSIRVHAVAHVTLAAPAEVGSGHTFVVTGTVSPSGKGRSVTLTGNGKRFTTLAVRADGSFSGHVRLKRTTDLSVALGGTASVDGAASDPRTVRVG